MSETYSEILYEVSDPVATITLNRPAVLNAWTPRMGDEVRHAVERAQRDPSVVGIVITGAGRGFCSGADMGTLQRVSEEGVRHEDVAVTLASAPGDASFGPDLRNGQLTYLLAVPKPVIAAINGAVAGMALALVLACDMRLMADDAVLITAFAARGLVAEYGVSWLLPRLVGPAIALDLLFSSRRVSGLEAAQLGLVNRAVPREQLMGQARSVLCQLAESSSPTSMSVIKRQVYQQMHLGLGEAEMEARELMAATLKSEDFAEGVRAFQEGRPPKFERIGHCEGAQQDA